MQENILLIIHCEYTQCIDVKNYELYFYYE